jgi:hypothetical protein
VVANEREKHSDSQAVAAGGVESAESFGVLRVYQSAPEDWLVAGYGLALARLRAAFERCGEPRDTFLPLFEALNYAATLIEKRRDRGEEVSLVMHGVRYARNRVHHHWGMAVEGRDVLLAPTVAAAGQSRLSPGLVLDWFWKALPPPPKEHPDKLGRDAYADLLEGRPVREALDEIAQAVGAEEQTE